jgi:hypothetical protein
LLGFPFASFAQKAYEAVYYQSSYHGLVVHFTLADGYLGASEISLTEGRSKIIKRFVPVSGTPDEQTQLRFEQYPGVPKVGEAFFLVNGLLDDYVRLPMQLSAAYHHNGKVTRLLLYRQ